MQLEHEHVRNQQSDTHKVLLIAMELQQIQTMDPQRLSSLHKMRTSLLRHQSYLKEPMDLDLLE